jgi:hypothetical protein
MAVLASKHLEDAALPRQSVLFNCSHDTSRGQIKNRE